VKIEALAELIVLCPWLR